MDTYNTLGMLVREKLIEPEVLYKINNMTLCFMWSKFRDVIAEGRKHYSGEDTFSDFEFLNNEILRIKSSIDPSYKVPETLTKYVPSKWRGVCCTLHNPILSPHPIQRSRRSWKKKRY